MSERSERFKQRVDGLLARFENELDRDEWATRRYPMRLRDEAGRFYNLSALYFQKGPTNLLLSPFGYDCVGVEGSVHVYLLPTYDPMVYLDFKSSQWVIAHVFPFDPTSRSLDQEAWTGPLTPESLIRLFDAIAEQAIPSI